MLLCLSQAHAEKSNVTFKNFHVWSVTALEGVQNIYKKAHIFPVVVRNDLNDLP